MSTNVHNLPPEVLLCIISLNGNIFHDSNAFGELRMASQVCRSWRTISLSSTVLWGHAIDLDSINVKCEDWLHEILRRTGNTLLWVKFEHLKHRPLEKVPASIVHLLKNHWNRIEILVLHYLGHENQQILYRSTLCLRTFSYNGPLDNNLAPENSDDEGESEHGSSHDQLQVLAGTAPALRNLKITCSPMHPKRHMSLFSNLRSLSTSCEVGLYTLFEILRYTQRLEELDIDCIVPCDFGPDDLIPLPGPAIVKLPHLRHLHLFSNKDLICDFILGHLAMSDGASLDLELAICSVDDIELTASHPKCLKLPNKVGQLAERYFEIHRPATLNIAGSVYRGLTFESGAPVTHQINPFCIYVDNHSRLLFDFIHALSFSGLSCIKNSETTDFFKNTVDLPCEGENMRILDKFHECLSITYDFESRLQREKEEAMALEEQDKLILQNQCNFIVGTIG